MLGKISEESEQTLVGLIPGGQWAGSFVGGVHSPIQLIEVIEQDFSGAISGTDQVVGNTNSITLNLQGASAGSTIVRWESATSFDDSSIAAAAASSCHFGLENGKPSAPNPKP